MASLISVADLLQNTINFKELKLAQYRQLLKCFLGEEIHPKTIFTNINSILEEITFLTTEQIANLSFLDYILLLLQIRQVSIGSTIHIYTEIEEQKQLKIDLNTDKILNLLNNKQLLQLFTSEKINSYIINFRLPSINEILFVEEKRNIHSLYTFFLKSIEVNNKIIDLEKFTIEEKEEIAQKIPIKVMSALTKRTHLILETFNKINILQSVNTPDFDKKIIFVPNSQLIAFIIKLLFNASLEAVYDYIFALSKMANISSSFLDTCSPGEFYLLVKKLEEVNARQNAAQKAAEVNVGGLPPINSEFSLE